MKYIKEFFCYTFDFVGVTSRKKFWITMLIVLSVNLVISLLGLFINLFLAIEFIFALVTFLPSLSIAARRLHDTDRTAWNLCWLLFPFVGLIIISVYCSEKTKYLV